ncbi:MAG: PHP domain-containing protein [Chloroflexota bacterium]|nr:PHP domain-containing protein [Chloroflexota bacterium]MDE2894174.1 PHP domain-containing protein [Chloroflexota bacterium]
MARVDLHLHSTYSDGTRSPEWVVRQAAANGAELIALTDHDTLAGVADAQAEGRRRGLEVVAGVEIGVNDPLLGELHVLGFFSNDAPLEDLERQLTVYRTERESRARRTVARLTDLGVELEYDTVVRLADGASIGRPHIARAMVAAGHVESVQEAFDRYLRNDGPAYVPRTLLSLAASIEMIHHAGGFSSLAHPTRYERSSEAVEAFADAGGQGIEIYYRNDGPEEIANGARQAQQLGLIPTVGSDFHGLHPDELRPATVAMPAHAAREITDILRSLST